MGEHGLAMASLLSPRRTQRDLVLRATTPAEPKAGATAVAASAPRLGWAVTAVAGGLLCALTGWLLVAGVTVLGWLAADPGTLVDALAVGTRLWLAGQGVGVAARRAAGHAGAVGHTGPDGLPAQLGAPPWLPVQPGPGSGRGPDGSRSCCWPPTSCRCSSAPRCSAAPASLPATSSRCSRSWAVRRSAARAAPSASTGPARGRRGHGSLPRAVLTSQLVLLAAGAAVLFTGLALHLDRVAALQDALAPGPVGGVCTARGTAGADAQRRGLGDRLRPRRRVHPRQRVGGGAGRHGARDTPGPPLARRAAGRGPRPGVGLVLARRRSAGRCPGRLARACGADRRPGSTRRAWSGAPPGCSAGWSWSAWPGPPAATSAPSG